MDPNTTTAAPATTTNKRPRPASPEQQAPGQIYDQGFLEDSKDLLDRFPTDDRRALSHDARHLLETIAHHLSENTVAAHTGSFPVVVQLVNTLFEIAAAVTNLADATDDAQARDLDALHHHAVRGMALIGAAPASPIDDDGDDV